METFILPQTVKQIALTETANHVTGRALVLITASIQRRRRLPGCARVAVRMLRAEQPDQLLLSGGEAQQPGEP